MAKHIQISLIKYLRLSNANLNQHCNIYVTSTHVAKYMHERNMLIEIRKHKTTEQLIDTADKLEVANWRVKIITIFIDYRWN